MNVLISLMLTLFNKGKYMKEFQKYEVDLLVETI